VQQRLATFKTAEELSQPRIAARRARCGRRLPSCQESVMATFIGRDW
jgi:hypothetical protein